MLDFFVTFTHIISEICVLRFELFEREHQIFKNASLNFVTKLEVK